MCNVLKYLIETFEENCFFFALRSINQFKMKIWYVSEPVFNGLTMDPKKMAHKTSLDFEFNNTHYIFITSNHCHLNSVLRKDNGKKSHQYTLAWMKIKKKHISIVHLEMKINFRIDWSDSRQFRRITMKPQKLYFSLDLFAQTKYHRLIWLCVVIMMKKKNSNENSTFKLDA